MSEVDVTGPTQGRQAQPAGDTPDVILEGYPWLGPEAIQACLVYARRLVGHERIEPLRIERTS